MNINYAEIRARLDHGEYPERYLWSSVHQSVRSRDPEATFTLAYHYLRVHGKLHPLARDWFLTAADLGHPLAPRFLAEINDASRQMREQLRLQAEANDLGAQVELSEILCRNTDGLGHDLECARHWLRLAAEQGNEDAQTNLADLLLRGEGGPADPVQAIFWLEKAASNGAGWLARILANLYETGEMGVPRDPERSAYWHSKMDVDKLS